MMWRRFSGFCFAMAQVAAVISFAGPSHAACGDPEVAKFLYRQGTGQSGYGNMGTMWVYNRETGCSVGANTMFMRLGLVECVVS